MKAKIVSATFQKEYTNKFGLTLYSHKITFDVEGVQDWGYYSSKTKEQSKFIPGQEAEFSIEQHKNEKGNDWNVIKPIYQNKGYSKAGQALQREQSKYSGFAMSYAKDLTIAGTIKPDQMFATAKKMFDWMVEQDKNLLQ